MTCKECKYVEELPQKHWNKELKKLVEDSSIFRCRRFPPTKDYSFPQIVDYAYCGEFALKEQSDDN